MRLKCEIRYNCYAQPQEDSLIVRHFRQMLNRNVSNGNIMLKMDRFDQLRMEDVCPSKIVILLTEQVLSWLNVKLTIHKQNVKVKTNNGP